MRRWSAPCAAYLSSAGTISKDYVLVPFGGAGPLHACELADALSIRRILLPPQPGVLSALGLLMADIVYDTSVSAPDDEPASKRSMRRKPNES